MADDRPPEEAASKAAVRRRLLEALLIATLALVANLAGNGRTSLWDRDEPRYAGCAREMMARGDWLFPTFNAEPRYHKPILIYWLMRLSYAALGDTAFAARLPSSLAGAATCVLVLILGRRLLPARAAFLGALMLAASPIMIVESKLATTDATLALCVVIGQFALWELTRRDSLGWALTLWTALALATLLKGPVGPGLVLISGVVSWWWGGPTSCWRRLRYRWGLPLFLLLVAPWFIAIGVLSHGDFYRFALGRQLADRVTSSMEQHGGFPGYYLVAALATFHPWSALLPAALHWAWTNRRIDPRAGFLLGWIVGPWLLLECVRTKLVHYYLPAIPAAALLAGWMVTVVVREGVNLRRWPLGGLCLGLLGGLGLAMSCGLLAAALVLPGHVAAPSLVTAGWILIGTVAGVVLLQRGASERAVLGLAGCWTLAMLTVGGWLLPQTEPYRLTRIVGAKLAVAANDRHASPVLFSFQEPTVIHTMGRPAYVIRTWTGFYEELDRRGTVVSAVIPNEYDELVRRGDHLEVTTIGEVEGVNLNKFARQHLRLVEIRRKEVPEIGSSPALESASRD